MMAPSDVGVMSQQDVSNLMEEVNKDNPAEDVPNDRTLTEHFSQEDELQLANEAIVMNTTKPDSEYNTSEAKTLVDRKRSEADVLELLN